MYNLTCLSSLSSQLKPAQTAQKPQKFKNPFGNHLFWFKWKGFFQQNGREFSNEKIQIFPTSVRIPTWWSHALTERQRNRPFWTFRKNYSRKSNEFLRLIADGWLDDPTTLSHTVRYMLAELSNRYIISSLNRSVGNWPFVICILGRQFEVATFYFTCTSLRLLIF